MLFNSEPLYHLAALSTCLAEMNGDVSEETDVLGEKNQADLIKLTDIHRIKEKPRGFQ